MNMHAEMQNLAANHALKDLEILTGEWKIAATHPAFKGVSHGHCSFEWMQGGAFLLMHTDYEQPGPPGGMAVIGRDEKEATYSMLYYDERDVARIYGMSFEDSLWKLWRESPGFSQRLTARLSDDSATITARWEKSIDGATWEPDLELTYTRASQAA